MTIISGPEKSVLECALEKSCLLKERSSECRREFFARPGPPPLTINFVIPPEVAVEEEEEEDIPNKVGSVKISGRLVGIFTGRSALVQQSMCKQLSIRELSVGQQEKKTRGKFSITCQIS